MALPPDIRSGHQYEPEPDDQALLNVESPEFRAYMDELYKRLPEYARRAAAVPAGAHGSVEWLRRIGEFFWHAREAEKLSRYQVAERMGIHVNNVRFLEFGIATSEELNNRFLEGYANALGKPSLFEDFYTRFTPPNIEPPRLQSQP